MIIESTIDRRDFEFNIRNTYHFNEYSNIYSDNITIENNNKSLTMILFVKIFYKLDSPKYLVYIMHS